MPAVTVNIKIHVHVGGTRRIFIRRIEMPHPPTVGTGIILGDVDVCVGPDDYLGETYLCYDVESCEYTVEGSVDIGEDLDFVNDLLSSGFSEYTVGELYRQCLNERSQI